MADDTPATPAPATTVPATGVIFSDTQFQALLDKLFPPSKVAKVESDVVAKMKAVLADAEKAPSAVKSAASTVISDVKSDWPVILVGLVAVASLAMQIVPHFVK